MPEGGSSPSFLRYGLLLLLATSAFTLPSYGSLLPTQGTFRGTYHVNRAGVGRFNDDYIVPRRLEEEMLPYRDKYIDLTIVKATQIVVPGPAIIDEIGKVTVLDSLPAVMRLRIVSPGAAGDKTFDVIYEVANTGDEDIVFSAENVQVGVHSYLLALGAPDADQGWLGTGYTQRQLSFGGHVLQRRNFLSPMEPGQAISFFTGDVRLRPGESAPFVLHSVSLAPGEYELVAGGTYYLKSDERVSVMTSQPLDVPFSVPVDTTRPSLRVEVQIEAVDEWFAVKGRLFSSGEHPAFIFVRWEDNACFLPGLIQLYAASGEVLPARLEWHEPDPPWVRAEIGADGLPFKFRVRHVDRFSREPVAQISLWTVTAQGVEKLALGHSVPDPHRGTLPPWGERTAGCRLRIDVPRASFASGEQIRFFFQTESDGKKADTLWIDKEHRVTHVVATIDGSPVPLGQTGIAETNRFPFHGENFLASSCQVLPGTHTLQLSIRGEGGTYSDSKGEKVRKFKGTLVSNRVRFEITDERDSPVRCP